MPFAFRKLALARHLPAAWRDPGFQTRFIAWFLFHYRVLRYAGVAGLLLVAYCLFTSPSRDELERWAPNLNSKVYDRDGHSLAEFGRIRRHHLTLGATPQSLIDAIISIEDREFFGHGGVDLGALPSALMPALWGERARGGSTLTQQLAKNAFLGPERSLLRKAREFIIAFRLEGLYTKAELLELYLNTVYLGGGVQGFADAAELYFGRPLGSLTAGEHACLAGLLRKPEALRPDRYADAAKARRNLVLQAMVENEKLDQGEADSLIAQPLRVRSQARSFWADRIPLVSDRLREELDSTFGAGFADSAGVSAVTSLDLKVQVLVDSVVRFHVDTLQRRRDRRKKIEAAVIVLDTRTGGVRAQLGGLTPQRGGYDRTVHARRSPGSSFKAVVYAAAIEHGASPADMIDDSPLALPDPDNPKSNWRPHNLEHDYDGRETYRRAFYRSRNIPAVRVAIKAGLDTVVETAHRLGLRGALRGIPALALGGFETSPWEMAAAFRALADGGIYREPHYFSVLRDRHGHEMVLPPRFEYAAVSPQTAFILCDMLRDVNIRGTAAAIWASGFTYPSGGKTGTSNDHRDAWYVGFTPLYTMAVWLGNDDFEAFDGHFTGTDAAMPIWLDIMTALHRGQKRQDFAAPEGLTHVSVCKRSGLGRGPVCDSVAYDWEHAGRNKRVTCSAATHAKALETMPQPVRRIKPLADSTTSGFRFQDIFKF